ncbi:hypothetical protein JW992_16530, partial [candidate division KSB1 bacterium]|nr:hypothetical protein [candidate division KSB1 bacterium]
MKRMCFAVMTGLFVLLLSLSCRSINEPEWGVLEVEMEWVALDDGASLSKTGSESTAPDESALSACAASISQIYFQIEPGPITRVYNEILDSYEIPVELGIYNILIQAFSADSTLLFNADTTEILVQSNSLTRIKLSMNPTFPWIAPEFVGLGSPLMTSDAFGLSWSRVANAQLYRLEESAGSAFETVSELYAGIDTSFQVSGKTDGHYYYRVRAENPVSVSPWSSFAHVEIRLSDELTIVTDSLPDGHILESYTAAISFRGGVAPFSCELIDGYLPQGLELTPPADQDTVVLISGVPEFTGVTVFALQITDSGNPQQMVSAPFSLTILPQPLQIEPTDLPQGVVNSPYQATLSFTGGSGDATSWISTGSLPPGLNLYSSVLWADILGTPVQAGSYPFRLKIQDNRFPQLSDSLDLSITIAPVLLAIAPDSLADGQTGQAYSQILAASGGTPPYTWSIASGALPDGLSLNAST